MLDTLQHHLIWGAVSPAYSSLVAATDTGRAHSQTVPASDVDSAASSADDVPATLAEPSTGADRLGLHGDCSSARRFRPSFQARPCVGLIHPGLSPWGCIDYPYLPPNQICLQVCSADSSQRIAIDRALEATQSFVVRGPPGCGKTQVGLRAQPLPSIAQSRSSYACRPWSTSPRRSQLRANRSWLLQRCRWRLVSS